MNTHEIQSNQKWKFHLSVENCKKDSNSTRINSEKGSINSNNDTKCVEIVVCIRLFVRGTCAIRRNVIFTFRNLSFQKLWTIFQFWTKWIFKNPHNHRFGSFFFHFSHTPKLITIDELLLSPLKGETKPSATIYSMLMHVIEISCLDDELKQKWTKN